MLHTCGAAPPRLICCSPPFVFSCSDKVEACGDGAEIGYTEDHVPVASEPLHEVYDAMLIEGDDVDIIDSDFTVNCTLYLGESCLPSLCCIVGQTTILSISGICVLWSRRRRSEWDVNVPDSCVKAQEVTPTPFVRCELVLLLVWCVLWPVVSARWRSKQALTIPVEAIKPQMG